jgi:phosphoribosylformimino-5-aminoimidazole carboxamide ribotide isomerase
VLIPAIDLMGGRVVQLEQGERLKIATDDLTGWIDRFRGFPMVQVIDLDAAAGRGDNAALVAAICAALPCQVGGGVRSPDRAQALTSLGARRVIVGTALFRAGQPDGEQAQAFADAVGVPMLVAALDSRGGRVVVNGWRTATQTSACDAARALAPFAGAFLYTHVDTEGLLTGTDIDAVRAVQGASDRPVIAAGGIRSLDEVDRLDALGVDAVVGMAIYSGRLDFEAARASTGRYPARNRQSGSSACS